MHIERYRRVLALPGVGIFTIVAFLARIPRAATGIILILYVTHNLHQGYTDAAVASIMATLGAALGSPFMGKMIDRKGFRPVLLFCTIWESLFWLIAPSVPYPAILLLCGLAGFGSLPVFSAVRQALAILTPADQQRQVFALDSMSVELSFMVGPILALIMATRQSMEITMFAMSGATMATGLLLVFLVTPTRVPIESTPVDVLPVQRQPRRPLYLQPEIAAQLIIGAGATMTLSGCEIAVLAALRAANQMSWMGVVFALWGLSCLIGGFIFGIMKTPVPPTPLLGLIGVVILPIGLISHWVWLCLAVFVAGMLYTPTITGSISQISCLSPASAKGEIMGWHGGAMTFGSVGGILLAGFTIDHSSPSLAFAIIGLIAIGICASLTLIYRHRLRNTIVSDETKKMKIISLDN